MSNLNWNASITEFDLASDIADRIMDISSVDRDKTSWAMDVLGVHLNGCPLDLAALLNADKFNFTHDMYGILRHLNRDTAKLENGFLPRFAHPCSFEQGAA